MCTTLRNRQGYKRGYVKSATETKTHPSAIERFPIVALLFAPFKAITIFIDEIS